jgi:hypothetical protein
VTLDCKSKRMIPRTSDAMFGKKVIMDKEDGKKRCQLAKGVLCQSVELW